MSNKYVKLDDVLAKTERVDYGGRTYRIIYVKDLISIPAADVELIVWGEWIKISGNMTKAVRTHYCSECGCHGDDEMKYCPSCGAYMERSGSDE